MATDETGCMDVGLGNMGWEAGVGRVEAGEGMLDDRNV